MSFFTDMTPFEQYYFFTPFGLFGVAVIVWRVVLPWLDRINARDRQRAAPIDPAR